MSEGSLSYLAISKQNSFGTATNSYEYIKMISESITAEVEQLRQQGLCNRFDEGDTVEGAETVAGDISMEFDPVQIGHFLHGHFGQSTSSAVDSGFSHIFIEKQTDFDNKAALPPYTIQAFRDTTESFEYADSQFDNLEISFAAGELVASNIGVVSRTTSLMTATGPSFIASVPLAWSVASASIGGVAIEDFEALTFSSAQNIEGVLTMNATKRISKFKRSSWREVRISGTMCFEANSEWLRFKAQSQNRLLVNFASMVNSGPTLLMDAPQFRYTSYGPNASGPGRISVDFEGDAKTDPTSNYNYQLTLINTLASY